MKEKMKILENVIEFYQVVVDTVYTDSELLEKRYALSENSLSMYIAIDYLEDKVTLNAFDRLDGKHYQQLEFDNDQKLEELINLMSECTYCDISLFELIQLIYKKFTPKVKWSDVVGDVNLTINHKPGTKPLTDEQIRANFRNMISSYVFQKDGDHK